MISTINSRRADAPPRSLRRSNSTGSIASSEYRSAASHLSTDFASPPDSIADSLVVETDDVSHDYPSRTGSPRSSDQGESIQNARSLYRTLTTDQSLLRREVHTSRTLIAELQQQITRLQRTSAKHEQTIAMLVGSLRHLTPRIEAQTRHVQQLHAGAHVHGRMYGTMQADLKSIVDVAAVHTNMTRDHARRLEAVERQICPLAPTQLPSIDSGHRSW